MSETIQLRAVDLFAGAGGLSLGLHMAGWNVVTAVEYDIKRIWSDENQAYTPHHDLLALIISTTISH